ncbi:hypothetical protein [Mycolicibacterium fortuitum]|uniref:hypothetical protein n=1 Tax=Mycolicibacterium fortuitum TaxID=1766 RepID=UPI00241FC60A|nr:hypothetical protein [Mycolicibacterium fortuitum]MDG5772362.1 hypothetical protein [Mycolicibacterium fortuitum]MDG5782625.1 hypothetical protein [Mycolicibacterium fortuitum]
MVTPNTTTTQVGHLPIPAGATADDWPSVTPDGVPMRSLLWLDLGEVELSGSQYLDDGRYDCGITVYAPEDHPLTAAEARSLAAKLIEAADALDRLQ